MDAVAAVSKLAPLLLEVIGLASPKYLKTRCPQGVMGGREMKGTDFVPITYLQTTRTSRFQSYPC